MTEHFINRYPLSKTLRFGLIPQGNTEENFKIMQILEKDHRSVSQVFHQQLSCRFSSHRS